MKAIKYNNTFKLNALLISVFMLSCLKSIAQPGNHVVDSRLVGTWMWTKAADGAYYNNNGTYEGPAYGLALEYKIGTDGYGTSFNHLHSTMGAGTDFTVDISSTGFFESDNEQHFGYFPLSGTYKTNKGTNRKLKTDELWNTQTNSGKSFLYQKLEFKTINGRRCFEVTSSNGITDRYWKIE